MFRGSMVAVVTPMNSSGDIEFYSFRKLIQWHLQAGTKAIVVNGTTGESASLTSSEKLELLNIAVDEVKSKIPVIAGTGCASTASTIIETRAAASCGVDACLVVTPYYVRPTQQGLYEHYRAVAESTELPIITYNVPKRTGSDLQPATLASLAHIENIIGIKEATGDILRVAAIKSLVGDRFTLLSGDDSTSLEFMQKGGHGVISVTANCAPELMALMCDCALANKFSEAEDINKLLEPLHNGLTCEPNPIPCKWALAQLGKMPDGIRLPLTKLGEPFHATLANILEVLKQQHENYKIA